MECEGFLLLCHYGLGDAEVGNVHGHQAVVVIVAIFATVQVDLRHWQQRRGGVWEDGCGKKEISH